MSSENVADVRHFVDAFNGRAFDALVADLDPDVELHEWPNAPGAQSYRGPDGVRRAIENWFESWEWMQIEIEDIEERGDQVLVTLHHRARGKGSEAEVELLSSNLYSFRDGRVVEIRLFTDRESALAALDAAQTRQEET